MREELETLGRQDTYAEAVGQRVSGRNGTEAQKAVTGE